MPKTARVEVRCTTEEKEQLERDAKAAGLSVSDFIRSEVLGGAEAPAPTIHEPVHFDIQPQPEERVKKILSSAKCRCGATRQAGAMCPNCKWVAR